MPGVKVSIAIFEDHNAYKRCCCSKCELLLKDPVRLSCTHSLCKSCADEIIEKEAIPQCPECGKGFVEWPWNHLLYLPDLFARRETDNLAVVCDKDGCKWKGSLRSYEEHARVHEFDWISSYKIFCRDVSSMFCRSPFSSSQFSCDGATMMLMQKMTMAIPYQKKHNHQNSKESTPQDLIETKQSVHHNSVLGRSIDKMGCRDVQSPESDTVGFICNDYRQPMMERNDLQNNTEKNKHDESVDWNIHYFSGQQNIETENSSNTSLSSLPTSHPYFCEFVNVENCNCDGSMAHQQLNQSETDPEDSLYNKNCISWVTQVSHLPVLKSEIVHVDSISTLLHNLKRLLLKEMLSVARSLRTAHEQAKTLEYSTAIPFDVQWLEFQNLLLLISGDVERNPGPLTSVELRKVNDGILNEDNYLDVSTSVWSLGANWHDLCLALGLPPSLLSTIKREQAGDLKACLRESLINWLQRNYNIEKHGPPTWRKLVEAVDHPAGGNNRALALKIAEERKESDMLPVKEDFVASDASSMIIQASCSDLKKGQKKCTVFANMYRTISHLLGRNVDIDELTDFLWCLCLPQAPHQRYVDPRVYGGATSTRDVLKSLCPEYVNPKKLFVLQGIVETFGTRQCKRLLKDYTDKFYS